MKEPFSFVTKFWVLIEFRSGFTIVNYVPFFDLGHPGRTYLKALAICILYFLTFLMVYFASAFGLDFEIYSLQRVYLLILAISCCGLCILFLERVPAGPVFSVYTYLLFFIASVTPSPQASFFAQVEVASYFFVTLGVGSLSLMVVKKNLHEYCANAFAILALIIGGFFVVLNFIFYWFAGDAPLVVSGIHGVFPLNFENVRFWSHTATWLLPLLPLAILKLECRGLAALMAGYFVGIIWVWMLFATVSRGSLLSLVSIVIVTGLIFRNVSEAKLFFRILRRILIGGFFLWIILNQIFPFLFSWSSGAGRSFHVGDSGRLDLWIEALLMSIKNLPFGMGALSWMTHEPLSEGIKDSLRYGSPHNMYLLMAAEYGWVFILIFLFITFRFIRKFAKIIFFSESSTKVVALPYFVSICSSLVHAFFSGIYIASPSLILAFFVWSISLSINFSYYKKNRGDISGKFLGVTSGILIKSIFSVLLLIFIFGVFEYYFLMSEDRKLYETLRIDYVMPRFWLHGYFPREPALMMDAYDG